MESVIEVKGLKKYFGPLHAVDNISFEVQKGEIFGFLGPNGAGKTTTIRCLMDFIYPTDGEIKILGRDAHKHATDLRHDIGYLPASVTFYDDWPGQEHIHFVERVRGNSDIAKELCRRLDFDPRLKMKYQSTGNRQKLGLILALMDEPKVLIMDEPTSGLDPLLQNMIHEMLIELKKKGHTIFMSSHNLSEVERICDRVGIVKKGKLIAVETIQALKGKKIYSIIVTFSEKIDTNKFKMKDVKIVKKMTDGLVLEAKGDITPLIKKLSQLHLKDIEITHATLEDTFLEFYHKS